MRTSGTRAAHGGSVLCPVDFSDHSRLALEYAAAVAVRRKGRLRTLFVNDPFLVAAAAAAYNRDALGAASEVELQRFLASTIPARTRRAITPTCETALGKPALEILRAANEGTCDLVVLGTKGLNGAKRLLLGSTTAGVLRRARVPVLAVPPIDVAHHACVKPGFRWPGRTIVAAIEFGPRAAVDVRKAAGVARAFGTHLVLVHAVPTPAIPPWLSADVDAHLRQRCAQAEAALDALRKEAGNIPTRVQVRVGDPPDVIADIAADCGAGLIVMGLRGKAGLFGEAAGTHAYRVLCRGVAPVLALPDERQRRLRR
ncbi:MAG: universal stress protein [Vicinamibacterales bacterium]